MSGAERVAVYDSQGSAYEQAFQVFLDHTDQKAKMREWLEDQVQALPSHELFVDAGAGTGTATAWFLDRFERTIAIEPNPFLRAELCEACPTAEVLPDVILEADVPSRGSLVLCSHVFYYVERDAWGSHLEKLASWLAPDGVLFVVLQNPGTDCMRMLRHFHRQRFDLSELADRFRYTHEDTYHVAIETVPARVFTPGLDAAYTVAEFMLNLLPMPDPPLRADLEAYVSRELAVPGGYRLSCDQDFLCVCPRRATEEPVQP
jgi:SAM-dependent methyltransferase